MTEARESFRCLSAAKYPQQAVPIVIWYDQIQIYEFDEINKTKLVFIGGLFEKQGVQLVLLAVPRILTKVPLDSDS